MNAIKPAALSTPSFAWSAIPAAAQTAPVLARPAKDTSQEERIVVTGVRTRIAAAFDSRRDSVQIFAEDVGKQPRARRSNCAPSTISTRAVMQHGGTEVLASERGTTSRFVGRGHVSILQDGTRDYIVYHGYDTQRNGVPTLQVRPIGWTADGWSVAQ